MSSYVGAKALLFMALTPFMAAAAEPATFVLQASGFEDGIVANEQGRLVQDWPGKPQLLVPGRWVAVDFESQRSVWFDDAGRVSLRGAYVEIRQGALTRHPDDPDQRAVFSVWSRAGTGLMYADGSTFLDWQPERGDWACTAHPQRYSWRARTAGERIFDQDGRVRLQLLPDEMRAAGPFAGRAEYLVCDMSDNGACALRDEDGTTVPAVALDGMLSTDRLWTSRYVEAGGKNRTQVTLHRLDGSVVARWMDATPGTSPMLRDLPGQGPVAELLGRTVETTQGSYFGQQWVDREGRTLFLSVDCKGTSRAAEGGVIEPLQGKPRYHGAPCAIPDVVRASMARQPEPAP